jgi:hypothetical protein
MFHVLRPKYGYKLVKKTMVWLREALSTNTQEASTERYTCTFPYSASRAATCMTAHRRIYQNILWNFLMQYLLQDGSAREVQFCGQLEALIWYRLFLLGYVRNISYMDEIRNLNHFKTTKGGDAGQVTEEI